MTGGYIAYGQMVLTHNDLAADIKPQYITNAFVQAFVTRCHLTTFVFSNFAYNSHYSHRIWIRKSFLSCQNLGSHISSESSFSSHHSSIGMYFKLSAYKGR